jgi:hypothetical protein
MAWRRDDRVPDELRATALWSSIDDPRLSPETQAALAQAAPLDPVWESTIGAVVAGILSAAAAGEEEQS